MSDARSDALMKNPVARLLLQAEARHWPSVLFRERWHVGPDGWAFVLTEARGDELVDIGGQLAAMPLPKPSAAHQRSMAAALRELFG